MNNETTQYIEMLASRTSTNIKAWKLSKIFGAVTDKNEINKRFMIQREKLESKSTKQAKLLERKISRKISIITKDIDERDAIDHEKVLARLKKNQATWMKSAAAYRKKAAKYLERVAKANNQIFAIEKKEETFGSQVAQAIKDGFWDFYKLSGNKLSLVTRDAVVLSDEGVFLNLGKYVADIDLNNRELFVRHYGRGRSIDGCCHPHVSDGEVCWGTAQGTVDEKLPKGEVADVLKLLASVLTNYNRDNPHVRLERFAEGG